MACPWANIKKPEPVNLTEIMSEEVARDLQAKENEKLGQGSPTAGKSFCSFTLYVTTL